MEGSADERRALSPEKDVNQMARIHLLDLEVSQLIAAGEVVERPGSVVKELVENSIDAGATAVTVEIRGGGNTFLRVTDNGSGILREDCPLAFLRHATSKVREAQDLDAISTLGFRGEALASVAAVARVELVTKTREEEIGTRFVIQGGEILELDDAGCPDGTSITVTELFYNTPARQKFLKKDVTEANNIAQILDRLALSHPEISFRFLKEGSEQLSTPGDGALLSAIYAVQGRAVAENMCPVHYASGAYQIEGYICLPLAARANRNMQTFFLNGRFIRSKTLTAALEQAYKDNIQQGKFPACVINVSMPCALVDVNVHPAKVEVRFADERALFQAMYYAVKNALLAGDTRKPEMQLHREEAPRGAAEKAPAPQARPAVRDGGAVPPRPAFTPQEPPMRQQALWESGSTAAASVAQPTLRETMQQIRSASARAASLDIFPEEAADVMSAPAPQPAETLGEGAGQPAEASSVPPETSDLPQAPAQPVAAPQEPAPLPTDPAAPPYRYLGEAFETYILAQHGDELLFVDKHALHERVIYDRLRAGQGEADCQQLLTPLSVSLPKEEYNALLAASQELKKVGFTVEDFGAGTVLVRSVPMHLADRDVPGALAEIAGQLIDNPLGVSTEKSDWLYHSVACRSAIKAGDRSSPQELMRLLEQVDDVRYCPHGRPVAVRLSRQKLEKEFHRL